MFDELPEGSDTAMASRWTRLLRESALAACHELNVHTAYLDGLAVAFGEQYFIQIRNYNNEISELRYIEPSCHDGEIDLSGDEVAY